jgi:hypothetical protein
MLSICQKKKKKITTLDLFFFCLSLLEKTQNNSRSVWEQVDTCIFSRQDKKTKKTKASPQ